MCCCLVFVLLFDRTTFVVQLLVVRGLLRGGLFCVLVLIVFGFVLLASSCLLYLVIVCGLRFVAC